MAGSTFGTIMIVIAAVIGLVVMEALVLAAAEHPYFKRSHPDPMPSKVRGGVHLGDPRSLTPPQDEPVQEAIEDVQRDELDRPRETAGSGGRDRPRDAAGRSGP